MTRFLNKLFCFHKWSLLRETVTKSRIEVIKETGCTNVKGLFNAADRKHIQVFTCEKCGKLKRFVENI